MPTEIAAMLMALAVGLACFALAFAAPAKGGPGAGMAQTLLGILSVGTPQVSGATR